MSGRRFVPNSIGIAVGMCVLLWASMAAGQTQPATAPRPTTGPSTLQQRITDLVGTYEGKTSPNGIVGVSVRRCDTGRQIVGLRSGRLFVPASNQKILTSAFVLAALGGDFRFDVRVYAKDSDLVIVGDFDPTLGDPVLAAAAGRSIYTDLDNWAAAAKEHFQDRTIGRIRLLVDAQTNAMRHPDWPQREHQSPFAAPACSLNFANNCIGTVFDVRSGKVRPTLTPTSRYIRIVNRLNVGSRNRWSLRGAKDMSEVTLRGTVVASAGEQLPTAIDNPPMLLGRVLAGRLARHGVPFAGSFAQEATSAVDLSTATLLSRTRRPLRAAMWRMNKYSMNMTAESVLLRAGDGTWAGSAKAMTESLMADYGLEAESFRVSDGSGLSAGNRAAPEAVTDLLTQMLGRDDWAVFVNSLPLAGVEGRVRNRLAQPPYRGRVLAKTGYIYGAQCLSGYVMDTDNRPVLAYSILVNGVPGGRGPVAHRLHDAICRMLVDSVDGR
ncbi:hypothetical protein LCGC14_0368790 [marine sediment metagenome]|uniref:D-alanyl-D-alanine carboxypeptidase/D-alanyl-D-alanine-endopeptidase n=1 Tax=marine sediment metagenome TaxID=412755 RepID=A0A0F9TNT6_9ZZZZ|nr:D-alanyl-D-alanine carboxypeptidase/D-alanyl-D-alanine-endopeptidase [Phycisphaerae bacterium]HDZ44204.1 D-alanyl-D-alanine carboxypeptidase/D-alanyl-D-alanine-endopeptidase [Phycisphaerae bacterium]